MPDERRNTAESPVIELTDAGFLDATTGAYTFVDLWAPWCAPCRRFSPVFEQVAEEHGDAVRFATCNVDENPETAEMLQVQTIPTVVLFDPEGNEAGRVVNPPPGSFGAMVQDVIEEKGL